MKKKPEKMYLDLLKKTLSFFLWPEPPIPVSISNYNRFTPKGILFSTVLKLLAKKNLQIVKTNKYTMEQRLEGRVKSRYADTMIGIKRLNNLQECIETVINEKIAGDFIETGAWKGGACIFMKGILAAYGITGRKIFVADSFEGLPKPDIEMYPDDAGDSHHLQSFFSVSQEDVENNFKKYNMLDHDVIFLKGWFKDTLPKAPIEKLSILRLDGDMYGSTMESLQYLYPKLLAGGFCIIDDYALAGCKLAVDDYRKKNKIKSELKKIDWTGRYWRKAEDI